jgi:DNA-binding GntR family transcriptional regulator
MLPITRLRLKRSYCRWAGFFGLAPNGDVPDITELAQRHDLSLGRASERVSIVLATKDVAMHLGIPAGANVLKLDRVAETANGEPVEWRVTFRKIWQLAPPKRLPISASRTGEVRTQYRRRP